jgi:hypothetical protein
MDKDIKIYILDIDTKYNKDSLPIKINDNEILNNCIVKYDNNRVIRSQYSLEIVLHNMFSIHSKLTKNYDESTIIFVPVYLFALSWEKEYYYNVNNVVEAIKDIYPILDKCINDGKKIIMVYSDVMWDDERCFINYFKFHKNIYIVCYEDCISENNQIPIPYCTHIKSNPDEYIIPNITNKKYLIGYAGRERPEVIRYNEIQFLNTNKLTSDKWISINTKETYIEIDDLYLNCYFSLQPHGDRKSRRGFYHSLLLGCIPVIFENNYKIYEKIFKDFVNIQDISIILNKEDDLNIVLNSEIKNIPFKIKNINKIKNLLLYDEKNLTIIDHIIKQVI